MVRSFSMIVLLLALACMVGVQRPAYAQSVLNSPIEGLWIARFFGSDKDTSGAAQSSFCGARRSPFRDLYFQFGRVKTTLEDEYGYRFDLAGAFIGRNFIGEVRLTDGQGLELLGPAKGVLTGSGQARISFKAKNLSGASDLVCNAVLHLKKGAGGD
ncbi:hypothetical protein EOI86_05090 [Hwanghaeella grinnelliae]|uniref:DUF2147 domain-containing protein n=1 Tax=Hwanghaeella grinnelliae TaxID=2500179 RepID=A0A3S2VSD1_9PROT|nr:hypothetical protein [Hwanghaeella grinnelliae]RVU38653.1 hypothetical protein EOI86_05090 [Hwanghaeella grinnelliae]